VRKWIESAAFMETAREKSDEETKRARKEPLRSAWAKLAKKRLGGGAAAVTPARSVSRQRHVPNVATRPKTVMARPKTRPIAG
jgi:hypothetical protein